jgi:hypothetical protein
LAPAAGGATRGTVEHGPERLHRLADVLDTVPAGGGEGEVELAPDLVVDAARHPDPARLAQALDPRGDVDAVAEYGLAVDDDIAQVDADTVADAPVLGQVGVAGLHRPLDRHRRLDGAGDAREFHDRTVALEVDEAPAMLPQDRFDQLAAQFLEAAEGAGLVGLHQPRVTDNVGGQDGREPAFDPCRRHGRPPDDRETLPRAGAVRDAGLLLQHRRPVALGLRDVPRNVLLPGLLHV